MEVGIAVVLKLWSNGAGDGRSRRVERPAANEDAGCRN